MAKHLQNICLFLLLAVSFASCSKEEFNVADSPHEKSLIKDADSNHSGVSGTPEDIIAFPDSRNNTPVNPEPEVSGASSDESGKNGISDDDDEENDDDRKIPGKPKRK